MAAYVFNIYKEACMDGSVDLDTSVIKLTLIMTTSTLETQSTGEDFATVDAVTTLGEMDGSGFTWGHGNSGRKTLASIAISVDNTDNEGVFDSTADVTWSSLGVGAANVAAVLVHKEGSADDTTAVPVAYNQFSSSVGANGGDFTVQWAAEGIVNLT